MGLPISVCAIGFDYTPALIHLSAADQHDSIGFNLVEDLPEAVYDKVLNNEIALWDSPKKNIRITKSTLQNLEKNSNTSFKDLNNLFIHEIWKLFRKDFEFTIVGITFSTTKHGKEVVYGYMDLKDIYRFIESRQIETNANGPGSLTYLQALNSKLFNFDLVQLGDNDFKKKPQKSWKIVDHIFNNSKMKTNCFVPVPEKEVVYQIAPVDHSDYDNQLLLNKLSEYLTKNKQVFYNYGGDMIYSHLDADQKINVTKVVVCEGWSKKEGVLAYRFKWIDIYVDDKVMKRIRADKIDETLDFLIKFTNFKDFILAKSFLIQIQSVNDERVDLNRSTEMYNALATHPWNKVSIQK